MAPRSMMLGFVWGQTPLKKLTERIMRVCVRVFLSFCAFSQLAVIAPRKIAAQENKRPELAEIFNKR